jgi:HEAT repeat protein
MFRHAQRRWLLLALASVLTSSSLFGLRAQAPDPVEELRTTVEALENKKAQFADLQAVVGRLKSLPDLLEASQVRQLVTTRQEKLLDLLEQNIRDPLKGKIDKAVRDGTDGTKLALAVRIGEIKIITAGYGLNQGVKDYVQFTLYLSGKLGELVESESSSSEVRQAAARGLGNLLVDPAKAVSALKTMFAPNRGLAEKRTAAAAMVSLIKNYDLMLRSLTGQKSDVLTIKDVLLVCKEVTAGAATALHEKDAIVRRAALDALLGVTEFVGSQSVLPTTPPFTDVPASHKAIEPTLQSLNQVIQDPGFTKALTSADGAQRLLSLKVLEKLGNIRQRIELRLEAAEQPFKGDADVLRPGLEKAVKQAAVNLRSPNVELRLATAEFLELVGKAAAVTVPDLKAQLRDVSPFVRWVVVRVLGKIGTLDLESMAKKSAKKSSAASLTEVVLALATSLNDKDLDVRITAAENVASLAYQAHSVKDAKRRKEALEIVQRTVPALVQSASAPLVDYSSQVAMLKAISATGVPPDDSLKVARILSELLRNPAPQVRQSAAATLGSMGPLAADAAPALQKALQDEDEAVRAAASRALLQIKSE